MAERTGAYFIFHQEQVQGPLSREQVERLLAKGAIDPATLCATDNAEQWLPVEHVLQCGLDGEADESSSDIDSANAVGHSAAASVFFGVLGVLCLGVVVLHRHWGFSLLAGATILAIGCGTLTLLRGSARARGRYDSGLAMGGITAGGLALLTGSFLVFAVHANPAPELQADPAAAATSQPSVGPKSQKPAPATEVSEPPAANVVDINSPAFPAPAAPSRAIKAP